MTEPELQEESCKLQIALNSVGMPIDNISCLIILKVQEKMSEVGTDFSISDSIEIKSFIKNKLEQDEQSKH